MRSDAPGFVLDASALAVVRRSTYAQALIRVYADLDRPIVVPAAALVTAYAAGDVDAAEFDPPQFTVTALNQAVAPAVALIISAARTAVGIDTAHAAYEAATTGYPVVTTDAARYGGLAVVIDVEELP
jgi:hypothetical protein